METAAYALTPDEFLRSVAASRDTLSKQKMRLIEVVAKVEELSGGAPGVVIGGLAQILWARKTHTDDLDMALAARDIEVCHERVLRGTAEAGWSLPTPDERTHEADDVFEVYHLLHDGSVVDLIAFRDEAFNDAILNTARPVSELGGVRFITPGLLLVTHLLRPGPLAALAAVELILARRGHGGIELSEARHWAVRLGREEHLERAVARADAFALEP